MPDERPALDPVEELAQLRADFEELKNTMLVRVARQPTGSIEPTLRTTDLAETLLLQGQTVGRATYPVLFQWVMDQGLIAAGIFGQGDGVSTFTLPDFRGRLVVGAGQLGSDNYAVGQKAGASTKVILPANMANHTHQVQVANHSFDVGSETRIHGHPSTGGHTGHAHQATSVGAAAAGSTAVLWSSFSSPGANFGNHYHGDNGNGHEHYFYISPHSIAETVVGQSVPFDVRAPYIALNWMIWT